MDHGEFQIQVANEQALIAQAVQVASTNMERPGCYWARLVGTIEQADGTRRTGHRIYAVDLFEGTVTITEEWEGVETARRLQRIELSGQ